MKSLQFKMLSRSEKDLVLAARPKELAKLDEDELIELHTRVRRARNKYSGMHRRKTSKQVGKDRARGKAGKKHAKVVGKTEVFEDVLSRVSRALSVEARRNSDALRDQRLAAAGTGKGNKSAKKVAKNKRKHKNKGKASHAGPNDRSRDKAPIEKRSTASQRSAKRRHEARRS